MILAMMPGGTVSADTGSTTVDNINYDYDTVTKTARVTGHGSISGEITVDEVEYTVTAIGGNAFHKCKELTGISIQDSVTVIENGAFAYCSALTSVTIPAGMTAVNTNTFRECSSLISVTFEAGSKVETIGENVFRKCSSLAGIKIPAGVMRINHDAFDSNTPGLCFIYAGTCDEWKQKQFTERINKKRVQYINVKPMLKERAYSSISLEEMSNVEYRIDGGSWQDTPVFTGLSSGTEYTFEVRYKAEGEYEASVPDRQNSRHADTHHLQNRR